MKRFHLPLVLASVTAVTVLPSAAFVVAEGQNSGRIQSHAQAQVETQPVSSHGEGISDGGNGDDDGRDITPLLKWASQNSIKVSPRIGLTSTSHGDRTDGDGGTDYGVVLKPVDDGGAAGETAVEDSESVLLEVPRSLVLDSKTIYDGWEAYLRPSMDYIVEEGFGDARFNFVLVVKLLRERSLYAKRRSHGGGGGGDSAPPSGAWDGWIQSLPRTFDTGTAMDDTELDCLPPFSRAMADYERERLRVFQAALRLLGTGRQRRRPVLMDGVAEDDELSLWAFNVVSSRSWVYGGEDGAGSDGGRSVMVPMGDMFNHRDPPNVVVRDSPDSDGVQFVLVRDDDGSDADRNRIGGDIFLSYGLTTNPHRFLVRFGFANTGMNEIFSQVLFEKPSERLLALGCNDRAKMVYRTMDGAIANAVWDAVLYSLLEGQVPEDGDLFYRAHTEGDAAGKAAMHGRYVMETSLVLRKHVVGELKELGELLRKIDGIMGSDGSGINDGGSSSSTALDHPRLPMIRRHNEFLYRTLDMVKQRIDARAQKELAKRKGEIEVENVR